MSSFNLNLNFNCEYFLNVRDEKNKLQRKSAYVNNKIEIIGVEREKKEEEGTIVKHTRFDGGGQSSGSCHNEIDWGCLI